MTAALIGSIKKEEIVKVKVDIPKSVYEEIEIYTAYIGGQQEDVPEVIKRMAEYVLERESSGSQGKKYKEFKQKFLQKKDEVAAGKIEE